MAPIPGLEETRLDERKMVEKETWGQPSSVRYAFRVEEGAGEDVFCAYSVQASSWPYLSSDSRVQEERSHLADEAWFFSKEHQASEAEADADIEAGRVATFDNVDDLIRDLRS